MANSYAAQGRYAEAVKLYEETLAPRKNKPGSDRFDTAQSLNSLAWLLAVCPDAKTRDPRRAVVLAERAVKLEPAEGFLWQTLAVAHYHADDWEAAVAALDKSISLGTGKDDRCLDWFFLAMAHWQLGDKDAAREWYEKGVDWMEKNAPTNEKLAHFRAAAAELLDSAEQGDPRRWLRDLLMPQ